MQHRIGKGRAVKLQGLDGRLTVEMRHQRAHIGQGIDGNTLHRRSLAGIVSGDIDLLEARLLGRHAHRQCAPHRTDTARKRQLTEKAGGGKIHKVADDARGTKNAGQDGHVKGRALLFAIGGGKVDGQATIGKAKAAVHRGGANTLLGLLDGKIGKTHDLKALHTLLGIALHADDKAVNTGKPRAVDR